MDLNREDAKMRSQGRNLLLSGIVLVFVVLGVAYSFANPPFESPDEHWHFAFVKHIADRRELPVQPPDKYLHDAGQEASQPPIYYMIGSLVISWIDTSDFKTLLQSNPFWAYDTMNRHNDNKNRYIHPPEQTFSFSGSVLAVRLLRWLSILFGAITVLCTYGIARQALPRRRDLAFASAAVVAFTPQFIFVNSSVTNDSAVAALASLHMLLLVRALRRGMTRRTGFLLGLTLGLSLLSKLSALMLVPLTVLAIVFRAWWIEKSDTPSRAMKALGNSVVCLLTAGAVSGWWYARNWLIYGEPTGSEMMLNVFGRRQPTPGIIELLRELGSVQESFWAAFGWGNVIVEQPVYFALNVLVALAGAGLLLGMARMAGGLRSDWKWGLQQRIELTCLGVLLFWCFTVFASLLRWMQSTQASLGRLLFPTIAALSVLLLLGIGSLLPIKTRRYVYLTLCGLLLIFATLAPFRYIAPAYARPQSFVSSSLATPSHPLSLVFGNNVELFGYDLVVENAGDRFQSQPDRPETLVASPGSTLKLTLYWRSISSMSDNYVVFVQLLDASRQILGQRDTFPGLGNYPTMLWMPNTGFRDIYYLPIIRSADAPVLASLRVGLYNPNTMARLPIRDGGQPVIENSPELTRVKVVSAGQQSIPSRQLAVRFANGILLEGYNVDLGTDTSISRDNTSPVLVDKPKLDENRLVVTLFWRAWKTPSKDYTVFTQLLGPDGRLLVQDDSAPKGGLFPTSVWDTGEQVVDQHMIVLPPNLSTDSYRLIVGLYDQTTGERVDSVDGGLADRAVALVMPPITMTGGSRNSS